MISVAVVNLSLILFDFTYFYARSLYADYLTVLTRLYDPVKGARQHPLVASYLERVNQLKSAAPGARPAIQKELVKLSQNMSEEQFSFGGQEHLYQKLQRLAQPQGGLQAYWQGDIDQEKIAFFEDQLQPLFAKNYIRQKGPDGNPVDYFLYIDLPFLLFFLLEFLIRWFIAIRDRRYAAWFLFPLYNWYDVLGLLPTRELRVFRLFRVISIYLRLRRSDLTHVGDDIISRTVKKYSDIIAEELSDMVAVRIIREAQDEIRTGTSLNVLSDALEPRREQIKKVLTRLTIDRVKSRLAFTANLRELLSESLERSAERVPSLAMVPGVIKKTLTREIGLSVFDAMDETIARELSGPRAEENVAAMVDAFIDTLKNSDYDQELNQLMIELNIEVLENIKNGVARKKWQIKLDESASSEP